MNVMKTDLIKLKKAGILSWLAILLVVHVNAILKNDNPLEDSQTEAILYDQKMEQEKDGVKAAATPKVIYYGGQGFLTKSSLAKNEKESEGAAVKKKKQSFNWSDWWEEKPVESTGQEQLSASEEAMPLGEEEQSTDAHEAVPAEDLPVHTSEQDEAADFSDETGNASEVIPPDVPQEVESKPASGDWW